MTNRRGAALLEALVAMAILTTASTVVVALTTDVIRAIETVREAEARVREASAFLDAVALWPHEDLDRRLGDRPQGPWRLRIQRTEPTLYEIVLSDTISGRAILGTALFRAPGDYDSPQ